MSDKNRLHIRRLDTVGLVDKGDNPKAEVVFFKRQAPVTKNKIEQRGDKYCVVDAEGKVVSEHASEEEASASMMGKTKDTNHGGAAMPGPFDVTKLPAEAQAEFKKLTDAVATLTAEVEKHKPAPEVKLPADVQKRLDETEKRAKDAEAEIAKLVDQREQETYITKAKEIGLNADDFATPLRKIAKALTADEFKALTTLIKAQAAQIREGELYKTIGRGGSGAATEAEGQLAAAAKEIRKAHPEYSDERARGEVLAKDVALRNRLEAERLARTPQPKED